MNEHDRTLLQGQWLRLNLLQELATKPPLFAPGEPLFWDDLHISKGMLAAHLDHKTDAASRRPEMIEATARWLIAQLKLTPGQRVLDLGCGPGLYATELARAGLLVTGVDYSRRSLAYAEEQAKREGLPITYIYQNYLELAVPEGFDVALLIYGDLNPLSDANRDRLLQNVHRVLKPGGAFVFDVTTHRHHQRTRARKDWYVAESGFWKPGPHLVLEQSFEYSEYDTFLDQYLVVEASGRVSVYRNWFHAYEVETIAPVLERQGFTLESVWSDLMGTAYVPSSEWIGAVARRGG